MYPKPITRSKTRVNAPNQERLFCQDRNHCRCAPVHDAEVPVTVDHRRRQARTVRQARKLNGLVLEENQFALHQLPSGRIQNLDVS
ncbi:hypothetical protein PIB30_081302 [Stylosanthes scabra]|uniref:Uncharacterized protein n=1 Tax=Stylosanthes scabra TaxID=79078 RepID=A0ABU6RS86_9FABA|nr:hypothetical protein [Stylosanthes scabra]